MTDFVMVPREPTEAMVTAGSLRLWSSPCIERRYTAEQWMGTAREVIREALSASPARGEGEAPVAWQVGRLMPMFYTSQERADYWRACGETVIPLYTHPTPATPEGLREKLEHIRDLLMERKQGSTARSPAHNARLEVEAILAALQPQAEGE